MEEQGSVHHVLLAGLLILSGGLLCGGRDVPEIDRSAGCGRDQRAIFNSEPDGFDVAL